MKATYVIVFFMVPLLVQGQKFDNNWVIGHDYNINDDEHERIGRWSNRKGIATNIIFSFLQKMGLQIHYSNYWRFIPNKLRLIRASKFFSIGR